MMQLSRLSSLFRYSKTCLFAARNMSNTSPHKNATDTEILSDTTVLSIRQLSPSIRHYVLKVDNSDVSFKAGQWADLLLPGISVIAGYSMCCSPDLLASKGVVELAVKQSDHAPTAWMHQKCKEGSEFQLKIGGDFYYDPKPESPNLNLLLLAAGIGINPLHSMLLHHAHLIGRGFWKNSIPKVHLMYSAKSEKELVFKESIDKMVEDHESFTAEFFVTGDQSTSITDAKRGRISMDDIARSMAELGVSNTLCYICGPSPMIEDTSSALQSLGVDQARILFEKWWKTDLDKQ